MTSTRSSSMFRTIPRRSGQLVHPMSARFRATQSQFAPSPAITHSTSRFYSTRDSYFLKPLKESASTPTYNYKFLKSNTVSILGCPFSGGQGRPGVDLAPTQLLAAGLSSQLSALGWSVHESSQQFKDLAEAYAIDGNSDANIGKLKRPRLVSDVSERIGKEVAAIAEKGWLPLTLGGDHSIAMGTVSGIRSQHPNAALFWIDAHADINTPASTDSGNMHGTPISFLLGLEGTNIAPFNKWLQPCLQPSDIVYIGLRDIDEGEKAILRQFGIKCFTMHDVDKYGIGRVMELAIASVNPALDRPVHLSFDVDAMDPSVAPSTGTPVRGGLTFREGHYITEALAETGCLVGVDIVEVNPSLLDPVSVQQTVAVGCSLARAALGETLL